MSSPQHSSKASTKMNVLHCLLKRAVERQLRNSVMCQVGFSVTIFFLSNAFMISDDHSRIDLRACARSVRYRPASDFSSASPRALKKNERIKAEGS